MNDEQLPVVQMLIERHINQEKESIEYFIDLLNSSGTTKEVRGWTDLIRNSKEKISNLNKVLEQMLTNELITKHIL